MDTIRGQYRQGDVLVELVGAAPVEIKAGDHRARRVTATEDVTDPAQTPLMRSRAAALQGTRAYRDAWNSFTDEERQALTDAGAHESNKAAARQVDDHDSRRET